ncbi:hypothetical protein [Methylobacterium dankookense]|uniref:Uncharacterized protein n=1 Tax=Methylobacterium dankookense TaxID=560405 RepID=A0A564G8F6_9HYPH|nr:hypothetical protein [Methylobacterium dankookense]GJD59496.1 hypothetical protein IFDJLNFL_5424 [Methylobacterium dankookense]VUF16090.1 hypothetical protein MTDSW087_05841 [Methylobacterium dankookense]
MSLNQLMALHQFLFSLESQEAQRLAWEDAEQARTARARAEAIAAERLRAMLDANPSGQLGDAKLNDFDALKRSGLL